jgi:hypothetical protein
METENIQITDSISKRFYTVIPICIAFVLYYVIMAILSPAKKIASINNEFGFKGQENTTVDKRIFSDSAFIKVNRDKAYYQSRIIMAETDSISLALNLADSTALLEIKGVTVHKAKIDKAKVSKVFNKADDYAVSAMLSTPFAISHDFATIKKEPLMIKMAPKDTSEYKPDILPDTTDFKPVNFMMEMENGIRLYVYQKVGENEGGRFNHFVFDIKDRFRNTWGIIRSIFVLKVPEYHPYIRIRVPKADAKIIYRAVPRHGQIALFR